LQRQAQIVCVIHRTWQDNGAHASKESARERESANTKRAS